MLSAVFSALQKAYPFTYKVFPFPVYFQAKFTMILSELYSL